MPSDASIPPMSTRDPAAAEFWDERFDKQHTPWDSGGVPADFQRFIAAWRRPKTMLIPGCGSGHEVRVAVEAGWEVAAIDFSASAVAAAKAGLGPLGDRVEQADFFTYVPPWPIAVIYERAFLCALPPARWPAVVARWAELLPEHGLLAGYFYIADHPKGPPFGISADSLESLLSNDFALVERHAVDDSVDVFRGKEQWQVWRRKAA